MKYYDKHAAQSEMFMVHIIPLLLSQLELNGRHLSILDVGSRSGHGAALLQRVLSREAQTRLSADVTASNLNKEETLWLKDCFGDELPCITFDVNDDYQRQYYGKFDIVIASHMIEHTKDPHETFRNIASMAKELFVIACPYMEEKLHHGTWWHDSSIDNTVLFDITYPAKFVIQNDINYPYCDCFYGIYKK